jgi:hypothetical protein
MLGTGAVTRSLSHDLAQQMLRDDEPSGRTPPILTATVSDREPLFAVSSLGRSYGDIIGQLRASGAWLPSGLGALEVAAPLRTADNLSATIDRVIRNTGRVAIGSDAPAVPYGVGLHRELELLSERGISNDQILRSATAGGALALGLSLQTGTLVRGLLADLIVVDGDPLRDIGDLSRIVAVVRGGVWYSVEEL